VSVAGRGLHQHRFRDSGLVHRGEHLLRVDGRSRDQSDCLPPSGAKGVPPHVARDDVGMDVDDGHSTLPTTFTTFAMRFVVLGDELCERIRRQRSRLDACAARRSRIVALASSFATRR
jgi:hypothetical protein